MTDQPSSSKSQAFIAAELYSSGLSSKEVCAALGTHWCKARKLILEGGGTIRGVGRPPGGNQPHKHPPEFIDRLVELRHAGRSLESIGRSIGVSKQRVHQLLARAGAVDMRPR